MSEVDKWFSEWSGQHESEVTAELPPDVLVRMRQQMFTEEEPDERSIQFEANRQARAEIGQKTARMIDNLAAQRNEAVAKVKHLERQILHWQVLAAAMWGLLAITLGVALWSLSR